MRKEKINLFLDSGAYSAWSKGAKISLQKYIDFIYEHKQYLEVYVNLDDLNSPEKTWENQKEMERQGLSPLPVYHFKEDEKYLRKVLEYEYFGLGGAALVATPVRARFYDYIFSIICPESNSYLPTHKIHGFGLTSLKLMLRYPWYSVDSTSWVMTSRTGSIYIPRYKQGEWIYDEDSWKVAISSKSPSQKEVNKHFNTFSPKQQDIIFQYFEEKGYKLGKSDLKKVDNNYKLKDGERWFGKQDADAQRGIHGLKDGRITFGWSKDKIVETVIESGLSNDYKQRDELNVIYFLDLEKSMPEWPWPFKKRPSGGFEI